MLQFSSVFLNIFADFVLACPYRKFHPGMKIIHEHCVLATGTQ